MNPIDRRAFLGQLSLASAAIATPQYGFSGVGKADVMFYSHNGTIAEACILNNLR